MQSLPDGTTYELANAMPGAGKEQKPPSKYCGTAPIITDVTVGDSQLTVTFKSPHGVISRLSDWLWGFNITHHIILLNGVGGPLKPVLAISSPCTVKGLRNGEAYQVSIKGFGKFGATPWHTWPSRVVVGTVPKHCPIIHGVSPGDRSLLVEFKSTDQVEALWVSHYVIQVQPGGRRIEATASPCTVTDLVNGQPYTVSVAAVNCFGRGPFSKDSQSIAPGTVPGAPDRPLVKAGNASAEVFFYPPVVSGGRPIISYRIQASPGGLIVDASASPCVITGLTVGQPYCVRVAAVNELGQGEWSQESAEVIPGTRPGAVHDLAVKDGDSSLTIFFQPPQYHGYSPLVYMVQAHPGAHMVRTTSTTCTMQGLVNGQEYDVQVAAMNSFGAGPWLSSARPARPGTVPGCPQHLVITPRDCSIIATFKPPAQDGGRAITSYSISIEPGGFRVETVVSPCTVRGLTNGQKYHVLVRAVNELGSGVSHTPVQVIPGTVPGCVRRARAEAGNGCIFVYVDPPQADGGYAITGYLIKAYPGDHEITTTSTTGIIKELVNGQEYGVQVAAINAFGVGPFQSCNQRVKPGKCPGPPTWHQKKPAPKPLDSALKVSFYPPVDDGGRAITGYVLRIRPSDHHQGQHNPIYVLDVDIPPTTSYVLDRLVNGEAYEVAVAAVNALGRGDFSPFSPPVAPGTVPGVPSRPRVVPGNASVEVLLEPPANDGGRAITSYRIQVLPDGAQLKANTGAGSYLVTNLVAGQPYRIRVAAISQLGQGAWSEESAQVIPGTLAGRVRDIAVEEADSSVGVSFRKPTTDGGSPITHYLIQAHPGNHEVKSASTTCLVQGLTNGYTYSVRVAAVTAFGTGPFRKCGTKPKPGGRPGLPRWDSSQPLTPMNGAVSISFRPPVDDGGRAITGYVLRVWPDKQYIKIPAVSPYILTGLVNGATYKVALAAVNSFGQSKFTAFSPPTTPGAIPGSPSLLSVVRTGRSLVVTFTTPADTGGQAITSYVVKVLPEGRQVSVDSSPCIVNGLVDGKKCSVRVAAVNAIGVGAWSSELSEIEPAPIQPKPTVKDGRARRAWECEGFGHYPDHINRQLCNAYDQGRACRFKLQVADGITYEYEVDFSGQDGSFYQRNLRTGMVRPVFYTERPGGTPVGPSATRWPFVLAHRDGTSPVGSLDFTTILSELPVGTSINYRASRDIEATTRIYQYWAYQLSSLPEVSDLALVKVQRGCEEHGMVASHFAHTGGNQKNLRLGDVFRLQSQHTAPQFAMQRKRIEQHRMDKSQPLWEMLAWHGVRDADGVIQVAAHGFRAVYSNGGLNAYGYGCYFARDVSYSMDYACEVDCRGSQKRVYCLFLAHLVVGDAVVGQAKTHAPLKPSSSTHRYETMINRSSDPSIFVATCDNQSLPLYMVTFTRA